MYSLDDDELRGAWVEYIEPSHIEATLDMTDSNSIVYDWWDIESANRELAENILTSPSRALQQARAVVDDLIPRDIEARLNVRITNLPTEAARIRIRDIRPEHIGKLLAIDGLVRKVVPVRPRLTRATFACKRCAVRTTIDQDGTTIQEPLECRGSTIEGGCGRSGGVQSGTAFEMLPESREFVAVQKIEIQEVPEGLRGGAQPERITVWLEDDLVGLIYPGDHIVANSIIRATPRKKGREVLTLFEVDGMAVSTETQETAFEDVLLTPEDIEEIEKLADNPNIHSILARSIAPSLYGLGTEKRALLYQLFGGVGKTALDGTVLRGDIHILLMGDPGTAKSQLLRYVSGIAPRGIYASGKSASQAGLTAAAVKDDFGEGRWTLEAGALVLADKGLAAVDELDKMNDNDRSSMHEAMEQQTIHINKAGMSAVLNSRCSILAAANPQHGRFSEFEPYPEQFNLPAALISRFDFVFPITDVPNTSKDEALAEHILKSHTEGEGGHKEPAITPEFIRKYISYAKRCKPKLTGEARTILLKWFVEMRGESDRDSGRVAVTPRALEAGIRTSEAVARIRLSETVDAVDASMYVDLAMKAVKVMEGVGGIDVDKITTGIPSSERSKIGTIKGFIKSGHVEGQKGTPREYVYEECGRVGMDREKVKDILDKMVRDGDAYCPSHNIVAITPR